MPIITAADAGILLQTTFTTAQINAIELLIPTLQLNVIRYCRDWFVNNNIYLQASTISFTVNNILDSGSGFVEADFIKGDYRVSGSRYNDKIVTVTTVAAGSLTVSDVMTVEAAEKNIKIIKIDWPPDIKPAFAQYLNRWLSNQGRKAKSESLPGGYSITYKEDSEMLFDLFAAWRKL